MTCNVKWVERGKDQGCLGRNKSFGALRPHPSHGAESEREGEGRYLVAGGGGCGRTDADCAAAATTPGARSRQRLLDESTGTKVADGLCFLIYAFFPFYSAVRVREREKWRCERGVVGVLVSVGRESFGDSGDQTSK